jgi:hypothetical protein
VVSDAAATPKLIDICCIVLAIVLALLVCSTLTDLSDTALQSVQCEICGEYRIANDLLSGLPDQQNWATTAETLSKAARAASEAGDALQLGSDEDVRKAVARYLAKPSS